MKRLPDRDAIESELRELRSQLRRRVDLEGAVRRAGELVELAQAHPDLAAEASHLHGLALAKQRRIAPAFAALERALAGYRALRHARGLGEVHDTFGQVHAAEGRLDLAAAAYAQSLAFKQASGDEAGLAITLGNLGRLHLRAGRLREARECFELDLEISRRRNDVIGIARMHADLGMLAIEEGELERAAGLLHEALALSTGDASGQAFFAHKELARIAFERADGPVFERHLVAARATLTAGHEPYLDTLLEVLNARRRLRENDPSARAVLADCAHQLEEADLPDAAVAARIELARAFEALGNATAAERQLYIARSRVRRFGLERLARVVDEAYLALGCVAEAVEERERFDQVSFAAEPALPDGSARATARTSDGSVATTSPASAPSHGYRVLAKLGEGRFGVTYKVYDPDAGDVRVLKLLKIEDVLEPRVRALWLQTSRRELLSASRLRHPGVARVFALGEDARGTRYVVQEWIDGPSLRSRIDDRERPLSLVDALASLLALAHSLDALHEARVIHGDLKPQNVILREGDARCPVLIDFGFASCPELPPDRDVVMGTPSHMAPELWRGETGDERADVYALGVVAREMLGGEAVLVDAGDPRVQELPPRPLRSIAAYRDDLPEALVSALDRAVDPEPARRPRAAELANELAPFVAERARA